MQMIHRNGPAWRYSTTPMQPLQRQSDPRGDGKFYVRQTSPIGLSVNSKGYEDCMDAAPDVKGNVRQ